MFTVIRVEETGEEFTVYRGLNPSHTLRREGDNFRMYHGPIEEGLWRKTPTGYAFEVTGSAVMDQALVKGAEAVGVGFAMLIEAMINWATRPRPRAAPRDPREPVYLGPSEEV